MSELIDAREERQEILKGIIRDLHAGKDFNELKQRLARLLRNVSPGEIAAMESRLIAEGMPEEEIKRLCDVHAALFRDSLVEEKETAIPPGHPVHTFRLENDAIRGVLAAIRKLLAQISGAGPGAFAAVREDLQRELARLAEIDKHYLRKENQLFPLLEKRGVYGPPKVMWQVHDDIRAMLKEFTRAVAEGDAAAIYRHGEELLASIEEMINKEENILFPMALEKLTTADWVQVRTGEEEIGYTLVSPGREWQPQINKLDAAGAPGAKGMEAAGVALQLATGSLTPEQVNLLLTHLPIDITYVDENDNVRYYSAGKHRIFTRSPAIIGRKVQNCHPPASVHVVEKILAQFRDGSKNEAEFWLTLNGRFIHIRYFAVRDAGGRYRGVVEVTQDVTDIRALQGEKRLLDW